jgi:hypothetical protein
MVNAAEKLSEPIGPVLPAKTRTSSLLHHDGFIQPTPEPVPVRRVRKTIHVKFRKMSAWSDSASGFRAG